MSIPRQDADSRNLGKAFLRFFAVFRTILMRRENQRMKELMSEPLEVNRYHTWLPPPPPRNSRMARVVETSLRDDSRLPDSIYRLVQLN